TLCARPRRRKPTRPRSLYDVKGQDLRETTSTAPRLAAPRTLAILAASVLLASAAVPAAMAQVPPAPHAESAALTAPKRPISPAPRSASKEEAEHRKRIDTVIAPVLQTPVSADDLAAVKQAFAAISAGDIAKATGLRSAISNATAKKLVIWYGLSRGFGAAAEYRDFLEKNPTWPQRWLLQQRMEESLFMNRRDNIN
ncbi:MAG: hypothetical protein ACK40V_06935, partial [Anaerolineales bacterium]